MDHRGPTAGITLPVDALSKLPPAHGVTVTQHTHMFTAGTQQQPHPAVLLTSQSAPNMD